MTLLQEARTVPTSRAATADDAAATRAAQGAAPLRTIWGLDSVQLHARYWASRGVQVVRPGETSELVRHAELYLLLEPHCLTLFPLAPLMDTLNWVSPRVLFLRLHDRRGQDCCEEVQTDPDGRLLRIRRLYGRAGRLTRVALTPDRDAARLWAAASGAQAGWRQLRQNLGRSTRASATADGAVYDCQVARDLSGFMSDVVRRWPTPGAAAPRAIHAREHAWVDPQATVDAGAMLVGPVWVGAGRSIGAGQTVIGPAVLWDDLAARPAPEAVRWLTLEPPNLPPEAPSGRVRTGGRVAKRLFDIAFALAAVTATLPLFPAIMLAIWLEDGGPFFFAHRRESIGGREFPCIKFRSMRKDAEMMKAKLLAANCADGPQFFMREDPRLTRVGRWLRRTNLDELPQFFNVLAGDMSVVGPRPSPFVENQFCPGWREARLSVRPGITGLWQVSRTRQAGSDFQEWIRYDIEYVERRSFGLDLLIIARTIREVFQKKR